MAVLEHVGRKSGRRYRTPLIVFSTADGIAVLLTYGPDRDWLKNVHAAGEAQVLRHGKRFSISDAPVLTKKDAVPSVTGFGRLIFGWLPFDEAVLLTSP